MNATCMWEDLQGGTEVMHVCVQRGTGHRGVVDGHRDISEGQIAITVTVTVIVTS